MKESVKLSVIVPIYNLEKYIKTCVQSIQNQTYKNLEIILVNDGSTDNSLKIIHDLQNTDDRIRVIHKKNGGVSTARLQGIKNATGDWIGFVDGDDYIEATMYEKLLKNAMKYDADISHCGYQMIFPNSRIDYYYNTGKVLVQDNLQGLIDLLSGDFIEPGLCNKLYKKELMLNFIENISYDEKIKINEDFLMNYYLFKLSNKSIYQDICPYHYLLRKNSATKSKINENQLKDPLTVTEIIMSDLNNIELKLIITERWIRRLIDISIIYTNNQENFVKKFQKECRKKLKNNIISILHNAKLSKKIRLMALWVFISPSSYRYIHDIYLNRTGLNKKYNID